MGIVKPLVCESRGGRAGIIDALDAALATGQQPVLAVVLETVGSTYASVADLALFNVDPVHVSPEQAASDQAALNDAASDQIGWLSGGCIERDLALHAQRADAHKQVQWIEVDSREDEDIFSGSATGCRGRLRLAFLPISAMPGWHGLCRTWLHGFDAMEIRIDLPQQCVQVSIGSNDCSWSMAMSAPSWLPTQAHSRNWTIRIAAIPTIRIYGAGPETPWLLPLLRATGWHTCVVESRPAWLPYAALADQLIECTPDALHRDDHGPIAALVMHHHFELDREALAVLSTATDVQFVGLLGPARRRDDLLRTLPDPVANSLRDRLHAPVGAVKSMRGAEAIALSVALQLQDLAERLRKEAVTSSPAHAATDHMPETEAMHG